MCNLHGVCVNHKMGQTTFHDQQCELQGTQLFRTILTRVGELSLFFEAC